MPLIGITAKNIVMAKKIKIQSDLSTEEKIKEAARKVFTLKGYAATRTRDIAEEAGLNLALLNYYFRSKEKLFAEVMTEKVQQLFGVIAPIINDPSTQLQEKIIRLAENYINMLSQHPDLPIFVLSELRNSPVQFTSKMQIGPLIKDSILIRQLMEKRPEINPLHFITNILGMAIFPFIAQPIFLSTSIMDAQQFNMLMEERKALIPVWAGAMLDQQIISNPSATRSPSSKTNAHSKIDKTNKHEE
jgi:AcrR family transcriptional regulator